MVKSLLILFTFSILTFSLSAQWTSDTALNTQAVDSDGGDIKAIGASDGSTYVVFWKVVAAPTNYELRLQVLDDMGGQQLGNDGILISDAISMSTFTVTWSIAVDQEDNILVGVTGTGDESGRAYKLDIAGNHLWGSDGVNVGTGYSLKLLPLSNGETIVSWLPNGPGMMQKFDGSGNTVWSAPQSVSTGNGSSVVADMFEMSDGGFMAVYHSLSFGISSTLYAQRFDGGGAAQWSSSTQLSNETTAFNREYGGTQDGDVIYYGYFASANNRFDAYVQRIDSDGNIPWGINGADFDTNETVYEMDTRIAYAAGSDYLWAICTYTNTSQSELGERVQKFDKNSGSRLLSENAQVIYPISDNHNKHSSSLFLVGDKPFFLISNGLDNGATPTTLGAVLLDESGEFFWLEGAVPVATYEANKSRTHLTRPVNGQVVTAFIEDKGNGPKIYAQNYAADELISSLEDIAEPIRLSGFPNPSRGGFSIAFQANSDQIAQVLIRDNTGALVVQKQVVLRAGENQIELDIAGSASGVYSYQLVGEKLNAYGNLVLIDD